MQQLAEADAAFRRSGRVGKQQRKNERVLFEKQGAAGINFDKYDAIKVERSGVGCDDVPSMTHFEELGSALAPFLQRNIQLMRYTRPTPIQAHAVPIAFSGKDLMCCAQTGSGKTCAFLLPMVSSLAGAGTGGGGGGGGAGAGGAGAGRRRSRDDQFVGTASAPAALVLAPTRELAIQISLEAEKLCNRSGLTTVVVYGGANARTQLTQLAHGVDLLVATPGRLQDFVDRNLVNLRKVQFLVLDEADRMLDMGFEPQIRKLVQRSGMPGPGHRQVWMPCGVYGCT